MDEFDFGHIHTTPDGRHFRHGDGVEVDGEGNPLAENLTARRNAEEPDEPAYLPPDNPLSRKECGGRRVVRKPEPMGG
jgi:hypothetical protein